MDDVSPFYMCILWTLDFASFFHLEVVVVRLSLIQLNVTQRLGIHKDVTC